MADEDNETEAVEESSGGGKMKWIIIGSSVMILAGVGIFAGPMIKDMIWPPEVTEDAEAAESEPSNDPALYTSLHPPLLINLKDAYGDAHFMQITMEVMARDQTVINSFREHIAVIRSQLILLYGDAIFEEVSTREGKEKLLADGLAEIQKVMTDTIGEPGIEAVYFTNLIIQ